MTERLAGKIAIITGAARGMGAASAEMFAREGARVVLVDKRDDLGGAVAAGINNQWAGAAVYVNADVTEPDGWTSIIDTTIDRYGPPQVLLNNAGIIRVQPLLETDLETFHKVIDTNLTSCFLGMRAVVPLIRVNGGGSIINVASPQGYEGRGNFGAYTASKFGVRGLTRTASIEFGNECLETPTAVKCPMSKNDCHHAGTLGPTAQLFMRKSMSSAFRNRSTSSASNSCLTRSGSASRSSIATSRAITTHSRSRRSEASFKSF